MKKVHLIAAILIITLASNITSAGEAMVVEQPWPFNPSNPSTDEGSAILVGGAIISGGILTFLVATFMSNPHQKPLLGSNSARPNTPESQARGQRLVENSKRISGGNKLLAEYESKLSNIRSGLYDIELLERDIRFVAQQMGAPKDVVLDDLAEAKSRGFKIISARQKRFYGKGRLTTTPLALLGTMSFDAYMNRANAGEPSVLDGNVADTKGAALQDLIGIGGKDGAGGEYGAVAAEKLFSFSK